MSRAALSRTWLTLPGADPFRPLREKLQIEIAAKDQEDPGDSVIRVQKASQGPCKQQRSEAKQRLIPVTL